VGRNERLSGGGGVAERSALMARIRGKDTGPEVIFRKALWHRGLRYRCGKRVFGIRPDIVFVRRRTAVFIDGCFWHGCPEHYVRHRTRESFWQRKLGGNVRRDIEQTAILVESGWTVLRLWEHEVFTDLPAAIEVVERALRGLRPEGRDDWRVARASSVAGSDDQEEWLLISLRDPQRTRLIRRERSTAKWPRKALH